MEKQNNSISFNNQRFYIGVDVHKKQWTVTIRSNKLALKTFSINPSAKELSEYMRKKYPGGEYRSVSDIHHIGS